MLLVNLWCQTSMNLSLDLPLFRLFSWNRKKSIAWNEKIEYIGFTHFLQVHKWVNYESMLEKCFVGKLKSTPPAHRRGKHEKNRSPWPDFVVLIPIWKQYEVSNAFKYYSLCNNLTMQLQVVSGCTGSNEVDHQLQFNYWSLITYVTCY